VEVFDRIFTPHSDRNPHWYGPFLIYGPPLLLGTGPAAFAWLILLKRRLASVRWVEFKRLFLSDDKAAFLVLWLSLPVLVLSLSRSRLPLYVLPFFPAVVLATARVLLLTLDPLTFHRRLWALALAMALILAAAKGAMAYAPLSVNMRQFHETCRHVAGPNAGFLTFDSTKLCGLQFYLDGQMKRVSDDPAAPLPQEPIQNVLDEIRARPAHDVYVFISTARRNDTALTALLDAAQVAYTTVPFRGHYTLFVVPTRMPPPS
jgi:4-amino-4-deoxy-L-arabinose transferase